MRIGAVFVPISPSDVLSGYEGDAATAIKLLFSTAAMIDAPVVLFFDECESTFQERTKPGASTFSQQATQTALQMLEGAIDTAPNAYVIAATNNPQEVDGAILSRFKRDVPVWYPGVQDITMRFVVAREAAVADGNMDAGNASEIGTAAYALAQDLVRLNVAHRNIDAVVERAYARPIGRAYDAARDRGIVSGSIETDDVGKILWSDFVAESRKVRQNTPNEHMMEWAEKNDKLPAVDVALPEAVVAGISMATAAHLTEAEAVDAYHKGGPVMVEHMDAAKAAAAPVATTTGIRTAEERTFNLGRTDVYLQ